MNLELAVTCAFCVAVYAALVATICAGVLVRYMTRTVAIEAAQTEVGSKVCKTWSTVEDLTRWRDRTIVEVRGFVAETRDAIAGKVDRAADPVKPAPAPPPIVRPAAGRPGPARPTCGYVNCRKCK